MPGTSSSGSAAAVAAGMVPLALGTQTAGSIVRPASYCGVVGFKPSFGAVPRTGVLKTTDTLDTIGVLSRTVDDAALAFDAIRVHGVDYPLLEAAYAERAARPRRATWRLAVITGPRSGEAEAYAREALAALATRLDAEARPRGARRWCCRSRSTARTRSTTSSTSARWPTTSRTRPRSARR